MGGWDLGQLRMLWEETPTTEQFLRVTCTPKMSRIRAMTSHAKAGRRGARVPDHSRVRIWQRANTNKEKD